MATSLCLQSSLRGSKAALPGAIQHGHWHCLPLQKLSCTVSQHITASLVRIRKGHCAELRTGIEHNHAEARREFVSCGAPYLQSSSQSFPLQTLEVGRVTSRRPI